MATPLQSLIDSGTKLWLDSVDPELVQINRALGATGATSNPIIVSDLIQSGRFDRQLSEFIEDGSSDEQIAWRLTDLLVCQAQDVFRPVHESTRGDDGYVSFELDPLIEDPGINMYGTSRFRRVSRTESGPNACAACFGSVHRLRQAAVRSAKRPKATRRRC